MARTAAKITLSPSRDIPLDRLALSQSNVRRIKAGVSIESLADDIARRGLLQSLSVRPLLDAEGQETGRYEIPAGGRRYRALELLAKRRRLAKDAPIPCVVRAPGDDILAEDDSFAENAMRESLHPLDQFRAMQAMVDKGDDVEAIAAHHFTTPAVVRQRLKLAAASPKLHAIYADDGMTLDQLMAFTVADDHQRQEEVWAQLDHSFNKSPAFIRQKLTEDSVRVTDKRAAFVGIDVYVGAGGAVVRDLFEADGGGWLTDPALLDRLVDEKLKAEGTRILAEGWKWVTTSVDLPWDATRDLRAIDREEVAMSDDEQARVAALEAESEALCEQWSDAPDVPAEVHARIDAIDTELGALVDRPFVFDPAEMERAGAFVSIDRDGSVRVERGFVRAEDEPEQDMPDGAASPGAEGGGDESDPRGGEEGDHGTPAAGSDGEEEGEGLRPLPDRLVSDLTAWRTLALQDAFAKDPAIAFAAVLHSLVLGCFYAGTRESCVQVAANRVYFSNAPTNLRDSAPAQAIDALAAAWKERLPQSDKDLWDFLFTLGGDEQAMLFAHCASLCVNAQAEIVPKYDNGRISAHGVARRIAHSDVLARSVSLDLVAAGWRPTVEGYFRSVTKPRILADVAEARGPQFAEMIDHLKKADMAREAERLLEDAAWLPEPMRTPGLDDAEPGDAEGDAADGELPAFLAEDADGPDDAIDAELPVAAE
ncbi:ParB/RepB/Spo0J family partition protein [Sphingopyxis sp. MG]|uniref:ParB/RepB/Spo0J family partition protein n=1 Tax=Sphingopyxis sp. MG TaxID=1866325 RepID=UPI000CDF38F5|nr:ParB/RepB/Spo0J family partition protein [Sphingopyxis sp. MG]AVA14723.1 chromosome partitioning protein ParB [Sphingopyxis sp. MG]